METTSQNKTLKIRSKTGRSSSKTKNPTKTQRKRKGNTQQTQ